MKAQQEAEKRAIAEKKADENKVYALRKRAEKVEQQVIDAEKRQKKAEDKAAAKAAAVKKANEEKAYAASKVAKELLMRLMQFELP